MKFAPKRVLAAAILLALMIAGFLSAARSRRAAISHAGVVSFAKPSPGGDDATAGAMLSIEGRFVDITSGSPKQLAQVDDRLLELFRSSSGPRFSRQSSGAYLLLTVTSGSDVLRFQYYTATGEFGDVYGWYDVPKRLREAVNGMVAAALNGHLSEAQRAIAAQRTVADAFGTGRGGLAWMYRNANDAADYREQLSGLESPDANEADIFYLASSLLNVAQTADYRGGAAAGAVADCERLLTAYLASPRERDPDWDLQARYMLGELFVHTNRRADAMNLIADAPEPPNGDARAQSVYDALQLLRVSR